MAGPVKVTAFVTKRGVVHRASSRKLKARSFPNGPGITAHQISGNVGRKLTIVTRPSGMYARGSGRTAARRGALGNTYHVTPSSARRFFALAARSR